MKKLLITTVLLFTFFASIDVFSKIHIFVNKGQDDYSWENELYNELTNSKYFELFGRYCYFREFEGINNDDYVIYITRNQFDDYYHGSVDLYQIVKTSKSTELCYRRKLDYSYGISKKIDWIHFCKNQIFEWIDDGKTSK